ncbi:DNA-binding IclR family transcriptional regulator [Thermocatellispora tengchongensis]|uniref:DNA-binding IclR family transcriptional regulator n=1 Tax=Thermocatellispora tengchongensis TaxID=1073253 RepID=A0A840P8X5_9ACTN|nr:IclR family transcriptional regulator [Thermocatellispora tengchongensis]MBB5135076.1 DNA-binding IclR family transcriptional regulator [Thermocatellispora tengchongensis]
MGRAVPAVSRALDILELFLDGKARSASQITELTGLPRTTVHELVTTLADRAYLTAEPGQPTRYRLGMRLFQLGNVFAEQLDLAHEALVAAREIAASCDETVHAAVLDGAEVVYIAKVDSTHPVRMVSAVGRRLPAHCTGVGKMLLSGLSPQALDACYPPDREMTAMTARSITSPELLRTELAEIRREGLAYDECESNEAVNCVAAPVHDHTGAMVAALSISVPILRWDSRRRREWGDLVRRGARSLSERLGHRPPGGEERE